MSTPTTPAEWREFHRQARVEEGTSLAEQEMLQALAGVVVVERLQRSVIVGTTKSGRMISQLVGEPSEAEQHLVRLQQERGQ